MTRSHWNGVLEDGEVRLGLRMVRGLRAEAGERIVAERMLRRRRCFRAFHAEQQQQLVAAVG